MLKKVLVSTFAVAALATGTVALDAKPAEAGVSIQLVHGSGHGGHGMKRKGFHGKRFGFYGPRRPFCFTKYRTKKVRFWAPRKHRWVTRKITRPVTICR